MCWWCVDDVLMMCWWCVDDVLMMCWWCVDDVLMMCWWCVDDVLMCWCVNVLMCWFVDVLMCGFVDLICWCVDVLIGNVYQYLLLWVELQCVALNSILMNIPKKISSFHRFPLMSRNKMSPKYLRSVVRQNIRVITSFRNLKPENQFLNWAESWNQDLEPYFQDSGLRRKNW